MRTATTFRNRFPPKSDIFSALKPERLQPHFRLDARLSGKHPRQSVDKFYCIHLYKIIFYRFKSSPNNRNTQTSVGVSSQQSLLYTRGYAVDHRVGLVGGRMPVGFQIDIEEPSERLIERRTERA